MDARTYFDSTADAYDAKYAEDVSPFLHHFFMRRQEAAIDGIDIAHKRIWDIGAGTGQLFRFFSAQADTFDYHAVDVARQMLDQSNIPAERRHVGTFLDVCQLIEARSVDLFFMLGVTTYMTDSEIRETLAAMQAKAAPGAIAVITITNRASVEFVLQRTAEAILRLPGVSALANSKTRVAGQSFPRNFMTLKGLKSLLPSEARIASIEPLNQTFTPLNRIATGPSLAIERGIQAITSSHSPIRRALSSDVLARIALN